MAATSSNVTLNDKATWVSLGSGSKGITVTAHRGGLVYAYASTAPSSTTVYGHILKRGETFSGIPDAGHFVWVRSGDSVVSYTEVG